MSEEEKKPIEVEDNVSDYLKKKIERLEDQCETEFNKIDKAMRALTQRVTNIEMVMHGVESDE